MHSESVNAGAQASAVVVARPGVSEQAHAEGAYLVECFDADGNLRWVEIIENLVTTAGKNDALDKYFAGSSYTAAWYLGLVDGASTPTFAAGDTMSSHAGWTENTAYSNSTRPAASWNSASGGSKATTATAFNISSNSQTIAGVFLTTGSGKSGTTGILYSCGAFSGGNRSVNNGDTLNVTWNGSL